MTEQITGALLKQMVINAAAAIENRKQEINELNVFPVPDGDTGTNMSLTIGSAEKALASVTASSVGQVAEEVAKAMLRGARGNSGVILSLLFRGLTKRLRDLDTANADEFAFAMANGVDSAYKAVMKPAEGTILTVSRIAAGAAVSALESTADIEIILEQALEAGQIALAETMHQNPVLLKAGVIDAGAKGYLYMLEGMLKALRGELIEKTNTDMAGQAKADFAAFAEEDITFTYCTECMVDRQVGKDTKILKAFLEGIGDSAVLVDDESIIKIHVHTDQPGNVLTEALTYGALISVKIENMREQHSEVIAAEKTAAVPDSGEPVEMKDTAVVVVCVGAGIEEVFSDLGADKIITGGQTMNPSTEDILEKINSAPSEVVFVLPNNKNIIMAAQQCEKLTEKRVIVIPTKSIPQGVSAMLAFDTEESIEEMTASMTEAAKSVRTALVTKAARDSVFDEKEIKKDEHLALVEDALTANGDDESKVFDAVAAAISENSPEFITIFTGIDAVEAATELLADKISEVSNGAEIAVISGGQPVYNYIISAE